MLKVFVEEAAALASITLFVGMIAVLLEEAVTVSAVWVSLVAPVLMPVRLTV